MSQQHITIGTANAGGGDTPFSAWTKAESNFTELYGAFGKGYIGDTALVNTLPGGPTTFKGNYWRRTVASTTLTTSDGSLMPVGLIQQAAVDNPSATNVADWIFWYSF